MTHTTMRPGIFTQVTVIPVSGRGRSRQGAALVCEAADTGRGAVWAESVGEVRAAFDRAGDETLRAMAETLLRGGVSRVYCVPVDAGGDETAYVNAIAKTAEAEELGLVLCDRADSRILGILKASVLAASAAGRERMGLCGFREASAAMEAAGALDCERMLLCCGSGETELGASPQLAAAALGALLLAEPDPGANFGGAALPLVHGLERQPSDQEVETLLAAGVIPLEEAGGRVECVRAVTTRTHTDGAPDSTYRSVSTVRIMDDVISTIRGTLLRRLKGMKNTAQTRESIASQVTVELTAKLEAGLLESFEPPLVYPGREDPSVCVVELGFRVSQVVNQIWLTAQIQV